MAPDVVARVVMLFQALVGQLRRRLQLPIDTTWPGIIGAWLSTGSGPCRLSFSLQRPLASNGGKSTAKIVGSVTGSAPLPPSAARRRSRTEGYDG